MVEEIIMNGSMKPKPIFVPYQTPAFTEMQKRAFYRGRGRMTRQVAPVMEKAKRKEKVAVFWEVERKREKDLQ